MNKLVKDGKVAVVLAKSFGSKWFTQHGIKSLVFDPYIVSKVESEAYKHDKYAVALSIELYCDRLYGKFCSYFGDTEDLCVEYVPNEPNIYVSLYAGREVINNGK